MGFIRNAGFTNLDFASFAEAGPTIGRKIPARPTERVEWTSQIKNRSRADLR